MKINILLLPLFFILTTNLSAQKSIYDYEINTIEGKKVSLSTFKGKVLLIVNTASNCGYTSQYADLQSFYIKNKEKGIEILGFPANNFMGQEPGSDKEIKQFCDRNYKVSFQMFSKISVKGKDMAPLYKFLTSKQLNGQSDNTVKWNFQKFLIDRKGKLVHVFSPGDKVTDEEIAKIINQYL
jgi:glutathione peroxidase